MNQAETVKSKMVEMLPMLAELDGIVARCYPELGIKPSGLH